MYILVDRAVLLLHLLFHRKKSSFINTSLENGYSLDLIFKTINHIIKNIRLNSNNIHKENEQIINQKRYSFVLPFINNLFKTANL